MDNTDNFDEEKSDQHADGNDNSSENASENVNDSKQESHEDDWKTIGQDPTRINIDPNIGNLAQGIVGFIRNTLSLRRQRYDYESVVASMRENIVFEGYNVWILVCSIVVASIGLNMDSMAVVIGAMLISPLMGPIRGIGFGVGMNDLPLLMKSLKNFGVMVGVSLVTSIVYFAVSPIDIANSQLLSRTEPNFLDAMIAFFGGLAGIIAAVNGKNDTVVNGVAIATALMPPLCTAGFSIANGEWTYFLGSAYLFLLNSLFIALSTLVLIRYIKFPKIEYISSKVEKRVRNYIVIFLTIIILPSAYLFYLMSVKSIYQSDVDNYVKNVIMPTKENLNMAYNAVYDYKEPKIELIFTNTYIDSTQIGYWRSQLGTYDLETSKLVIIQGEDVAAVAERTVKEAMGASRDQNELVNMLRDKEIIISNMQNEFVHYKQANETPEEKLDLNHILQSYKTQNSEISKLSILQSYTLGAKNKFDTTFVIAVQFKEGLEEADELKTMSRLNRGFKFELKEKCNIVVDSVRVIRQ